MPASHTNITFPQGGPVAITSGAVTAVRIYVASNAIILQATATNVAPISQDGALPLSAGQCLLADVPLAGLFSGVGAGPYYLWAWGVGGATISVSHA